MKLSKRQKTLSFFSLLLLVSISFVSMMPLNNTATDTNTLEVENNNHFFTDKDITFTEDIEMVVATCSPWQHYDTQDCNCTEPAWNSWFNKDKYRRWCRTGNVGWGGWQYSPWVCNTWCRYK